MTFEELDARFPNGFSDARLVALHVDYGQRTATLQLELRGNMPDSIDRDVYSRAVLTARDICYVSIDPPDAPHLHYPSQSWISFDAFPEDSAQFPLFASLKPHLPASAFCCRFFVHDWNPFIHIAARNGDFAWA